MLLMAGFPGASNAAPRTGRRPRLPANLQKRHCTRFVLGSQYVLGGIWGHCTCRTHPLNVGVVESVPWSVAAAPIWAVVCHFPAEQRRRRKLVIVSGYVDESENDTVFVLGGFVAPAEEWAKFSDAWAAALEAKPRIRLLKTNDAMHVPPHGEFRGLSEESRDEKLRLFYSII